MPNVKMNPAGVRRLVAPDPSGRQAVYSSAEQQGLQIVVSGSTGVRNWCVQGNLHNRTVRITIGPVSANVDANEIARMQRTAQEYRETMRLGLDPREEVRKRVKKDAADSATIGSLWDAHRATPRWQRLRQGTREIYDLSWRTCLIEMADLVARDVQLKDVLEYHTRWVSKRGYSLPRLAVILLKGIWKSGKLLGMVDRMLPDPTSGMNDLAPGWAAIKVRNTDIPDEDLPRFWAALDRLHPYTACLVMVLLLTGLRSSEARGLRWDEVSLNKRMIILPAERVKSKREFRCPLSTPVVELLGQLNEEREAHSLQYGIQKDFVFSFGCGRFDRMHPEINGVLREVCKRAGIRGRVTTHTMRKIFGRVAEEMVSLGATKKLLNHSVVGDVTLRHYGSRAFPQLIRDADIVAAEIMRRAGVHVVEQSAMEVAARN